MGAKNNSRVETSKVHSERGVDVGTFLRFTNDQDQNLRGWESACGSSNKYTV